MVHVYSLQSLNNGHTDLGPNSCWSLITSGSVVGSRTKTAHSKGVLLRAVNTDDEKSGNIGRRFKELCKVSLRAQERAGQFPDR